MRTWLLMLLLVGAVWVLDEVAFDGRYSRAAWVEAKYRGQQFAHEVEYWFQHTLRI